MKYNHMYDVAFTVETNNHESNVTIDELIEGLEKRVLQLKSERSIDAYGYCDSFELEQEWNNG